MTLKGVRVYGLKVSASTRFLSSTLLPFLLLIMVPLFTLNNRKKGTLTIIGSLRNLVNHHPTA